MAATEMGEYLFDIACHIVGYEDGEDAVEYVYELFHSNHNVTKWPESEVLSNFKKYNVKYWSRVKKEYTKFCNED